MGERFDSYPEPVLTLAEPLSLAKPVCSQHEQCKGCGCEKYDRRLVELFCSENSALGRRTKESIGCDVVRVHERMDMNHPISQQNAINALSTPNACAWISAPMYRRRMVQHPRELASAPFVPCRNRRETATVLL